MNKIKVLIVDDSAIVRDVLSDKLSQFPYIDVIGVAQDPFIARDKIVKLNPDVITLDIEMPKMDGITFLEKLMRYFPIPVIIVSSVTANDKNAAIKALELGAFDVVNKPGGSLTVNDIYEEIAYKIKNAYQVKDSYISRQNLIKSNLLQTKKNPSTQIINSFVTTDKIIAIGSSTGGTLALEYIFKNLPANLPPIVVVQHMPENYTKQFAIRLNELSQINIKEAEDGEILTNGNVYIAKGGNHLIIERKGSSLFSKLINGEKIQFQKPSVDVLFNSLAKTCGKNVIAALLTGMGKDGAEGLLNIKNNGGFTIIQDEESSVVWGMPKAAYDIGAYNKILSLNHIPINIVNFFSNSI
ncbi:MAG: chemotaxis response regulator protein-glutamate methylesterase [Spirochaetes bacterium GWC1_27_15]|nr:MAG: chemotaxis response regulator protein-glutamate methylesterase [Spirochaetes bacterium GWB1_27_13]OHD24338.1 MAG: chemotaxis response regulator protein-glutamate methylesterase [Spirochaetes bacterium GWC1_27_15]